MEKNLKAEIDKITSAAELNELLEYIEEKRNNLLPTLHKALEPFFDQHPGLELDIVFSVDIGLETMNVQENILFLRKVTLI